MTFRRKKPSPLEQLRADIEKQINGMARWELRQHIAGDQALAVAFATMRGVDLEHIRAIINNPRMTNETMVAQIREYMDGVW